jgi:hypothetical protein
MKIPAEQSAEHHYLGRQSKSAVTKSRRSTTSPHQRQGDRGSSDDDDDDVSCLPRRRILEGYLDEDEAAAEFGKTKQTLRRWRRQRVGPPFVDSPLGPLYPIAEGREYLRRNTVQPRSANGKATGGPAPSDPAPHRR